MKTFAGIIWASAFLVVFDFKFPSAKSQIIKFYDYGDELPEAEEINGQPDRKVVLRPENSVHLLFPPEDDGRSGMTPAKMEMFTTTTSPPSTSAFTTTTGRGRFNQPQMTTQRSTRFPDFYPVPTSSPSEKGIWDQSQTSTRKSKQYPDFYPASTSRPNYSNNNCNISLCRCGHQYFPICANNGVTYRNKCYLNCVQRNCNRGVRVRFQGICPQNYNYYG